MTVNFNNLPHTYDIDEHDPDLEYKLQNFIRKECSRGFRVNDRGAKEHKLHKHLVFELKDTASHTWVEHMLKQCGTADGLSWCIEKVKGGTY